MLQQGPRLDNGRLVRTKLMPVPCTGMKLTLAVCARLHACNHWWRATAALTGGEADIRQRGQCLDRSA